MEKLPPPGPTQQIGSLINTMGQGARPKRIWILAFKLHSIGGGFPNFRMGFSKNSMRGGFPELRICFKLDSMRCPELARNLFQTKLNRRRLS